jgi:preprotein translocase subunit YajC
MDFFLLVLQASPSGGGLGGMLLLWGPILLIFWFFMIRPQMKRHKQHQALIAGLARGDAVVTSGGIVGKVTRVQENEVEVEIAPNVIVKVVKHTITDAPGKGAPATPPKK